MESYFRDGIKLVYYPKIMTYIENLSDKIHNCYIGYNIVLLSGGATTHTTHK